MVSIIEEYQSAEAQLPAGGYALIGGQEASIAEARDSRLGIWISNGTPNSYCWIALSDTIGASAKYTGINVPYGSTFYTDRYLGGVRATAGINPVPLSNAQVQFVSDYGLNTMYLVLTTPYAHNIPAVREETGSPYNPPVTNEVRVYGTQRGAFEIGTPIYAVPDEYTLVVGAFAFNTVSAVDNGNGTFTMESDAPHRFDNDGQTYYIFNGGQFNITHIIDDHHYTITGSQPITGVIYPAPGFVHGWVQDSQPVSIGITEI